MNTDNSWQKSMYDNFFAKATLDSDALKEKAKHEASFLIDFLKLPLKAKILDVPCGTGRHSRVLAEKGFEVMGLDISQSCVDIAKSAAPIEGLTYQIGDMKDLSAYKGKFDCVLNLFTSFGYFSTDEENENVLAEMVRALKPSGKLVINVINREWLLSIYKPAFWFKSGSVITVSAGQYDPKNHYNESYMTLKDESTGETTLSYHRIRLYSSQEMVELMKKSGLKDIKSYGSFNGEELDGLKSSHPFYIGTK